MYVIIYNRFTRRNVQLQGVGVGGVCAPSSAEDSLWVKNEQNISFRWLLMGELSTLCTCIWLATLKGAAFAPSPLL